MSKKFNLPKTLPNCTQDPPAKNLATSVKNYHLRHLYSFLDIQGFMGLWHQVSRFVPFKIWWYSYPRRERKNNIVLLMYDESVSAQLARKKKLKQCRVNRTEHWMKIMTDMYWYEYHFVNIYEYTYNYYILFHSSIWSHCENKTYFYFLWLIILYNFIYTLIH